MSIFDLIVLAAMASLVWEALQRLLGLQRLNRGLRADRARLGNVRASRGSIELPERLLHDLARDGAPTVLEPLARHLQRGLPVGPEMIDRIEQEELAPVIARATDLAGIAPGIGLTITALSLSVGLFSGDGDAARAAERLVAALPSALLSTVTAMAVSVALGMAVSRVTEGWYRLRADFSAMGGIAALGPRPPVVMPRERGAA